MNTRKNLYLTTATFLAMGCGALAPAEISEPVAQARAALVVSGLSFVANDALADEHCALPEATRDSVGIGRQVRLRYGSPSKQALCTVDALAATQTDGGAARAELNTASLRARFNIDLDAGTPSSVNNVEVMNEVPGVQGVGPIARAQTGAAPSSSFPSPDVREWRSPTPLSVDRVIYTAPHAIIEKETFAQLEAALVSPASWEGAWTAMYRQSSGGRAFDAFHITSTDLHAESFPLLGEAITAQYRYALSFHGFSSCAHCGDVFVGGGEDAAGRAGLADMIRAALPATVNNTAVEVVVANGQDMSGAAATNFVNRLANGHGVQLEQSSRIRDDATLRGAVVTAARQWFDCLIETADRSDGAVSAVNTGYTGVVPWNYGNGRCPRATAEVDATVPLTVLTALPSACVGNSTVREDLFRRRADQSYQRIGGGGWHSEVNAGVCTWVADSGYDPLTANELAAGSFRVVASFFTGTYPRAVTVRAESGTPPTPPAVPSLQRAP